MATDYSETKPLIDKFLYSNTKVEYEEAGKQLREYAELHYSKKETEDLIFLLNIKLLQMAFPSS